VSFPRYPKYRDSGVEWLGHVPAHWDVSPVRRLLARIEQGWSPECESRPAEDGEWGVLKTGCANGGVFSDAENKALPANLEPVPELEIRAGDLLMSRANGSPSLVGSIAMVKQSRPWLMLSDKVFRLHPRSGTDAAFLAWAFGSASFRAQVESAISGADGLANNLPQSVLRAFFSPRPPLDEQGSIACFLDRETAKIDALVAEQQRLVDLLKEKRQAVLSHAVTKGLNPDALMKPSGIEWLGDVPAHWAVVAIKWLSSVRRGASPRPIDDPVFFDEAGEFAWVRIADVSASDGILREASQMLSDLGSSLSVRLVPGDLFVSIAGTVGKPCIAGIKACIHDGFVYFPELPLDPQFLYRIFEMGTCYGGLGKLGTQLNLNTDTIGSIRIAVPSAEEIRQVLAMLEHELERLDSLTVEAHRAIDLLEERRTALISAAVTGQIDVRGIVTAEVA